MVRDADRKIGIEGSKPMRSRQFLPATIEASNAATSSLLGKKNFVAVHGIAVNLLHLCHTHTYIPAS